MDIIKNSKYFSSKNEKIICSHFFLQKNENKSIMLTSDFRHNFFPKSKSPFQNWTFFLSIFQNPKYFCAKSDAFLRPY